MGKAHHGYVLGHDYHLLCSLELDVFASVAKLLDTLSKDAVMKVSDRTYRLPNGVKPLGLEDVSELEGWCHDVHAGLPIDVPEESRRHDSAQRSASGPAVTSAPAPSVFVMQCSQTQGGSDGTGKVARQAMTPQKRPKKRKPKNDNQKRKPKPVGVGTPCRAPQPGQYASTSTHGQKVKPSYTRTPLGPELTREERKKKWQPPVRDTSRFSGTRASRHSAYTSYKDPEYDSHDQDW